MDTLYFQGVGPFRFGGEPFGVEEKEYDDVEEEDVEW